MFGKNGIALLHCCFVSTTLVVACGVPDRNVSVKQTARAGTAGRAISGDGSGATSGGGLGGNGSGATSGSGLGGNGGAAGMADIAADAGQGGSAGSADGRAGASSIDGGGAAGSTVTNGGAPPATAGTPSVAGDTSTGSSASDECDLPCSGATPICANRICVTCTADSGPRCNGNAPELCVNGQWLKQALCGGATPACSSGICSGVRARGQIATVAAPPAASGSIRIRSQQLEALARSCASSATGSVCVSNGMIRP